MNARAEEGRSGKKREDEGGHRRGTERENNKRKKIGEEGSGETVLDQSSRQVKTLNNAITTEFIKQSVRAQPIKKI